MAKSNIVSISELSDSILFSALELKDRHALLAKGHKRDYQKGEVIFARGEEGDWLFLIEEGLVEISVTSLNGRKSVLNHMEQGEILGEIALFDREPRSAEALAISPVTGTVVHRQSVLEVLKNNNEAYFSIIKTLCNRVRNASDMFETLSLTSANARLARCLLRLGDKWGHISTDGSIRIDQQFSQTELGEFAGIARENVNRHLQAWIGEHLIHYNKGDITLLAPDKLNEIAEL